VLGVPTRNASLPGYIFCHIFQFAYRPVLMAASTWEQMLWMAGSSPQDPRTRQRWCQSPAISQRQTYAAAANQQPLSCHFSCESRETDLLSPQKTTTSPRRMTKWNHLWNHLSQIIYRNHLSSMESSITDPLTLTRYTQP